MTIKDLLEDAINMEFIDLQALIMFLCFDKKVLKLEDQAEELDLYFLEKHTKRINIELNNYKKQINLNYPPSVYKILTPDTTLYVYANDIKQAELFVRSKGYTPLSVKVENINLLMSMENSPLETFPLKKVLFGKNVPSIISNYRSYNSKRGVLESVCS